MTDRGDILKRGLELTYGDRNAAYGDPLTQLRCQAQLIETFDRFAVTMPPATRQAIHMALLKIARVAINPAHADSYLDGCVYMAIAGELAQRERAHKAGQV